MSYPPNSTPGAPDEAWSTPERGPSPVVGSIPATHAVTGTSPVYTGGDADAGGRDIVAGDVAGAVAAAEARYHELAGDTYGFGSHVGDLMDLPPVVSDMSKHTGSPGAADSGPAG